MELYIRVDDKLVQEALGEFQRQVPFALSYALNETAWRARGKVIGTLTDYFVIRNKWTERGINVEKSTKRHLVAAVGSTRDYMVEQTFGSVRKHYKTAVPLVGSERPRTTIRTITPPSKWPQALARKPNIFVGIAGLGAKPSEGKGVYGVWMRLPKALRSTKSKKGLKLLYRLPSEVHVPPRWPIDIIVQKVVEQTWEQAVEMAVTKAIGTMR